MHQKRLMTKLKSLHLLPAVGALVATLLAGCSTVETIDMAADRESNATNDLAALEPTIDIALEDPLTLDHVIAIGLKNNLDLRVAEYEKLIATDEAFREKLGMLPDLNVSADYDRRNNFPIQNQLNLATGGETTSTTVSDLKENTTATLNLSWNVLDLGLSYIRSRQAQLQAEMLDMREKRQAQLLALELTESYWKAALAEDALDYVKQVERELQIQKDVIERSVAEKRLDAIAAKEVEKKLIDIALSIRDLQADIASARLDLSRLMGLKQSTRFVLARSPIRPILQSLPRPDDVRDQVDQIEFFAVRNRPELFERDLDVRVQQDEAHAALLQMFPNLSMSFGRSFDDNFLLHSQAWSSAAVGVSWNLLQLPARFAAKDTAERRAEFARVGRLQMTVAILTQVHIALLDYEIAADRFRLHEDSYSLTSELLDMSRERNKAGILSNLAVTQRLLEDMATKLKRDQSVVDLIVAHRRLLASMGLDPLRWEESFASVVGGMTASTEEALPELPAAGSAPGQGGAPLRLELDDAGPQAAAGALPEEAIVTEDSSMMNADSRVVLELDKVLSTIESNATSDVPSITAGAWREPAEVAPAPDLDASARQWQQTDVAASASAMQPSIALAANRNWAVQLGAFRHLEGLKVVMRQAGDLARDVLRNTPVQERVQRIDNGLVRGQFPGLTQNEAQDVCDLLVENGRECIVVAPVN